MNMIGVVGRKMVDDEPSSQTAAVLHELFEDFQEENDIKLGNNEGLPDLVEFLFAGSSRIPYFQWLHNQHYQWLHTPHEPNEHEEPHSASWEKVVETMLDKPSKEDPQKMFEELLKRRLLLEEEKIAIVKQILEKTYTSQTIT